MNPAVVQSFIAARTADAEIIDVPLDLRPTSIAEGYWIQHAVHDALARAGDAVDGYKIGCATAHTQAPFGLVEPTYGGILRSTRRGTLSEALAHGRGRFAIECEIAVRIGSDSPQGATPVIDACAIACEIVQDRYGDAVATGVPTLVADDFFHHGYVLGPWRTPIPLRSLRATVEIDDATVGEGIASNVMDDPLHALAWLARALADAGRALRRGDVVLTGAIAPPFWMNRAPRSARLTIEGLGTLATS